MIDARRGWSLFALLLFACNLSLGQTKTNEGDVWLAKSPEARSSLLLGLTIGMSKGFGDGCATYYKNAPTQKPHTLKDDLFAKCIKHAPGFSNAMSYYEDRVTDFYTRFPNNRVVPIYELLKKLATPYQMTVSQMNKWFNENWHKR